jgi:hypothetical protein
MATIKNIKALKGIVKDTDLEKLEQGALLHQKYSNITFKIIEIAISNIIIRTEQGKTASENYASSKVLIERTKELFAKYLNCPIHVHPIPYSYPANDIVTPKWLSDHMNQYGIKVNDLVKDTGIEKSNISAWINGLRPMSKIVKDMFYTRFSVYGLNYIVNDIKTTNYIPPYYTIKKVFDKEIIELIIGSVLKKPNFSFEITENDWDFVIKITKGNKNQTYNDCEPIPLT